MTKCKNQIKQINLAIQNYATAKNSHLPPMVYNGDVAFFRSLLPYVELGNLESSMDIYRESITGMACPSDSSCPTWHCIHGHGVGSYAPVFQIFGSLQIDGYGPAYMLNNIPDGTSNVIFFTERFAIPNGTIPNGENDIIDDAGGYNSSEFALYSQDVPQVGIKQSQSDWKRPNTADPNGIVCGLGDGSVRIVSGQISQLTWLNACVAHGFA